MLTREQLQSLYRYSLCLTADSVRAEDLLQTALEKWLRYGKVPEYSHAYMRKIIRNQFVDECRRLNRVAFEPIDEQGPVLLDETSLETLDIQHRRIEQVFELLNSAQREVLYLWAIDGYTAAEIATALNQPRGTVLSRLHRIKQKVAEVSLSRGWLKEASS
ncbi:RNA polymerase sigma factor [Shewanella violacea]|uniref:RNA polymerase sigma-70 factor, ECF subfamily n=1 Tax=Shewanella violacea (strain JCM 10179 / CIP 106290 / LMG 19151 / DSS12) TaxID=637905 RepID=D4ZF36_SHEVD|nr:sigma-70 family RNA polymerase sigma factor [Shewanella violacea]BAJ04200.1 RNA polymerase sigma-70 factor, ECF subfamily [Shewanella violacea DSS12]